MENKKKIFGLMLLSLILGASLGFYFGNKRPESSKKVEIVNPVSKEVSKEVKVSPDANKQKLILQKIDLLKSYTDFILLPKEKISDPKKYADDMGEKVKAIGDDELAAKFYATGEAEGKEQKIIDFLDFLNDSVKADLQ